MADRRVSVKIDADPSGFSRGVLAAETRLRAFANTLDTTDSKMGNVLQGAIALGPAFVPVAAVATPAVAGLATQLGAAGAAAGVALLAFNGLGDAIGTINDYHLNPTTENLEKMRLAMEELGPAGAEMANYLNSLRPEMDALQEIAREGLFPGVQEGLEHLMTRLPEFELIVDRLASTMGNLASEAGQSLASDDTWTDFFAWVASDAAPALEDMTRSMGNVTAGVAELLMAFGPLSSDFGSWMVEASQSFEDWADSLAGSNGFTEFAAYVRDVAPDVAQAFGAIVTALVEITEAAGPVGKVLLPVIEGLADATAIVARSELGPWIIGVAAALNALTLSLKLAKAANASSLVQALGGLKGVGVAAALYGANRAITALEDVSRDAVPSVESLTLSLLNLGDAGVSARLMSDLGNIGDAIDRITDPGMRAQGFDALHDMGKQMSAFASAAEWAAGHMGDFGSEIALSSREAEDAIAALDSALAGIVHAGSPERAAEAFEQLAAAQGLTADQQAALLGRMPQYEAALEGVAVATELGTDATNRNTDALQRNLDAMEARRAEALRSANAELNYKESLLDLRKAANEHTDVLKKNGDAMKGQQRSAIEAKRELTSTAAAWNELSNKAQNVPGAYRGAIEAFVDAAMKMGMGRKAAQEYARELMEIPSKRATQVKLEGVSAAMQELSLLDQELDWVARSREARINVTTVYSDAGYQTRGGLQEADGGIVSYYANGGLRRENHIAQIAPAGAYRMWAEPETGGEAYIPLAQSKRSRSRSIAEETVRLLGGRGVQWYAEGGINYNLDQQVEMLRLEQSIRELSRSLEKNGKDALTGLNRTIAEVELQLTRRDLRQAQRAPLIEARQGFRDTIGGLRDARSGFEVVADMTASDVRSELRDFRKAIDDAGGRWTKQLDRMGERLVANAQRLQQAERAIERETQKRELLTGQYDDQVRALEDLQRTMQGFHDAVAAPFLSDPFNLSRTLTGAPSAGVSPATPDPALIAARDQLGAAEARLSGIRGRTDIDPLTRSYLASRAVAEVAELRSQVEQLDRGAEAMDRLVEPVEQTITGLQAFEEALRGDIERVTRFGDALDVLTGKGLDTTGPLGGLFQDLARSGDLGLAEELAGLTPSEIGEFEKLFATRGEEVATVAARATQAVYADQWQQEQRELRVLQKEMADANRSIQRQTERLENRIDRLGDRNERIGELLAGQVGNLQDRMSQLERERETNRQKAGTGARRR